MKRTATALALAVVCLQLTACGGFPLRDRRDAPWDPPAGRSKFEQIPTWDHPFGQWPCYDPRGCGGR